MAEDLDVHLPLIAAGDADAFGAFMAGAEPALRVSLRRFARSVDTEAVLQETLLRLWQVAPRFQPDGRPNGLLRLAHRVARNLAVSETRRARTRPVEDVERHDDPVEPATPDPALRRVIATCRDKLPAKPAEALVARLGAHGGVPDATLAQRLGMTKNTFLQNFTRARKMLLDCLKRHGVEIEGATA